MKKLLLLLLLLVCSGGGAQTRPHITDIRTIEKMTDFVALKPSDDGTFAILSGYYSHGDGGGGDFYWDATSIISPDAGIIITPTGHSGVGRWVRAAAGDYGVRPEWWGAKGDGIHNDAPAFQQAIDYLESGVTYNNYDGSKNCLLIGDKRYYFATQVVSKGNLLIKGLHAPKHPSSGPTSYIVGADSLESLFKFTGIANASSTVAFMGTTIQNVAFLGKNGARPKRGILFTSSNAPSRPVNISQCHFQGFSEAAIEVLASSTTIYNLNISESLFHSSDYALKGEGVGGFRFTGNTSEWGGKIKINNLFGTFDISDNLLEGDYQSEAIDLTLWYAVGKIGSNYWEDPASATEPLLFGNTRNYAIKIQGGSGGNGFSSPALATGSSIVTLEAQHAALGKLRVFLDDVSVLIRDHAFGSMEIVGQRLRSDTRLNNTHLYGESPYITNLASVNPKDYYVAIRPIDDCFGDLFRSAAASYTPGISAAQYRLPTTGAGTVSQQKTPAGIATCAVQLADSATTRRITFNVATHTTYLGASDMIVCNFLVETYYPNMSLGFGYLQNDAFETPIKQDRVSPLHFNKPGWYAVSITVPYPQYSESLWSIYIAPDTSLRKGFRITPAYIFTQPRYYPIPFYWPAQ